MKMKPEKSHTTKILVVYYSMYGHVHAMAQAIAEGAKKVNGTTVKMCRVPETLSNEVLAKMEALDAQAQFANISICKMEDLAEADAIIFGTPTR